jgi:hypothetical protein
MGEHSPAFVAFFAAGIAGFMHATVESYPGWYVWVGVVAVGAALLYWIGSVIARAMAGNARRSPR